MTNQFTQRQLDAIADFNWGAVVPPRWHRNKTKGNDADVKGKLDTPVQATDSVQAEAIAPADDLGW